MHVPTLADLLALDHPRVRAVHLPHPDAVVRWVATSDLADPTPYLEGSEILLITGLGTEHWALEWEHYVARLAAAGVAAVGVGTGLTYPDIPAGLLQSCRTHHVNVLEVPPATTFVSISRATAQLLDEAEHRAEREARDLQRRLVQAAARRSEPLDLLTALATALDGVASVVTDKGIAEHGPVGTSPERFDLATVQAELARRSIRGRRPEPVSGAPETVTEVHPLGLPDRCDRFLAVTFDGTMTRARRTAMITGVALLSLAIENLRAQRDAGRTLRGRAVELMLADDARSARIVLATGAEQPRAPKQCRILVAEGAEGTALDALAMVEEAGTLAALVDGTVVAVSTDRQSLEVAESLATAGLRVGVGGLGRAGRAARSHEQARHAFAETTAGVPVVHWDRLVGQGALSALDPARAAAFADSFLAPLDSPEMQRHELVRTLQAFLRNHGSRAKVANELGVHRNTVRHRITQIETLTGASLDEPQTRASAWIALRVRET